LKAGWKGSDFSVAVEPSEEVICYGGDITHIKTSSWKAGERSTVIEGVEGIGSYRSDVICIETSCWETGEESSIIVEPSKEGVCCCCNLTDIETS